MTCRITAMSIRCSARWAISTRLIERAHELGLKVMIDLVLSHTSDRHPWFVESRRRATIPRPTGIVWADAKPDGTPPNNWLSIFGGSAWHWDGRRMQYYLHNFLVSQPDLNFHNPEVQDALLDMARFWLQRGVDGFRLDTINFYFPTRRCATTRPCRRRRATTPSPRRSIRITGRITSIPRTSPRTSNSCAGSAPSWSLMAPRRWARWATRSGASRSGRIHIGRRQGADVLPVRDAAARAADRREPQADPGPSAQRGARCWALLVLFEP